MNARVILPISYYNFIMKDHKVDMLFYANNYKDTDEGLRFLESKELALEIFRKGQRVAKGTTSEVGLVSSYFANPFGPVQKEKETDKILENFFDILYKEGIPVGEIYTRLAVDGHHMTGPKFAARKLLELLTK